MLPFALAHGGAQVQIEETKAALVARGIEVEFLRWWDDRQKGDLIHFFGVPPMALLEMAHAQNVPVVVTQLFTAACNRSVLKLRMQGLMARLVSRLPAGLRNQLAAASFRRADRMVVGLKAEERVLQIVFGLPERKIVRLPLGLHSDFLQVPPATRDERHLVTTGTITERKRSLELARMAREAEIPVLFVGKPYHPNDPYWREFSKLIDDRFVLHQPHVKDRSEMIRLLRASRGFVIYSQYENWCLSAHEATACGLPVLLPDMPWARECFGTEVKYLSPQPRPDNAGCLRSFYDACPNLPPPAIKLYSWDEVAEKLEACYRSLI